MVVKFGSEIPSFSVKEQPKRKYIQIKLAVGEGGKESLIDILYRKKLRPGDEVIGKFGESIIIPDHYALVVGVLRLEPDENPNMRDRRDTVLLKIESPHGTLGFDIASLAFDKLVIARPEELKDSGVSIEGLGKLFPGRIFPVSNKFLSNPHHQKRLPFRLSHARA